MKTIFLFLFTFATVITLNAQNSFEVKVYGKGQPILLIPGYSCNGDVWQETVAHLKNNFELHVITIAGFAGVTPIQEENILETVKNDIILYTKSKKLNQPILIGHSLGAFMVLWLQTEEPSLFGKSICVDGVPFISAIGNPNATVESIKNNPEFNKKKVIENFKMIPDQNYVENMTKSMLYQVSDPVRAKQIAEWSFKSDRKTLGSTIVEMSTIDLRETISKIKQPILVMASIFGTKENSLDIYSKQYAQLQNKTIKVAESKHFIMYDAQEWFFNEIDVFLNQKS